MSPRHFQIPLASAALLLSLTPLVAAKPILNKEVLALSSGSYKVEFRVGAAYTLGKVSFQDVPILLTTGANQSVVNVKKAVQSGEDPWYGTAHGREEIVSINLEVDGQQYPVNATFDAPEGESYTLHKVSRLGPIEATTAVTVSAGGIDQTVSFKAIESDLIARYLFVFMHCFNPTFHDWMAVEPGGNVLSERFPDDRINSLKRDVERVGFYDEAQKIGVVVIYPEAYEGTPGNANILINWPGRHYKHYLQISPEKAVSTNYRCKLVAFPAEPDNWQKLAADAAL